jgi:hypothetical protein
MGGRVTGGATVVPGFVDLVEVGRGGFSVVYAATQEAFGRRVALKVLDVGGAEARRLEREAHALGVLADVPGVVQAHHVVTATDGRPVLVMALMPSSLAARMAEGPCDPAEACRLAAQLAATLDVAHDRGVSHRDIKPQNVLLAANGDAFLADWGIAAIADVQAGTTTAFSFSPPYAPPERLTDEHEDPRLGDVYSLGATLFAALAGAPPFGTAEEGGIHGLSTRVVRGELRVPDHLDAELVDVFRRAMATDPQLRYPTAGAFADALSTAVDASAATRVRTPARRGELRSSPPRQRRQRPTRRTTVVAAAAVVALVAAVALVVATMGGSGSDGGRSASVAGPSGAGSFTVTTTPVVGGFPVAAGWDGRRMWMADTDAPPQLSAVGAASNRVEQRLDADDWQGESLTGNLFRVVAAGRDAVWFTAGGDVIRADADGGSAGTVLAAEPGGPSPVDLEVRPGSLWVLRSAVQGVGTGDLLRLSPTTGAVEARIEFTGVPTDLAVHGNDLWVVDSDAGELVRIDGVDKSVISRFPVGEGGDPELGPMFVAVGGGRVWVASTAKVWGVDPRTGRIDVTVDVGEATDLAYALGSVWVLEYPSPLKRIDPRSGAVVPVRTGPLEDDGLLNGLAVGAGDLWVLAPGPDGTGMAVRLGSSGR